MTRTLINIIAIDFIIREIKFYVLTIFIIYNFKMQLKFIILKFYADVI